MKRVLLIVLAILSFWLVMYGLIACGAGGVECGPTGTASCSPHTVTTTPPIRHKPPVVRPNG